LTQDTAEKLLQDQMELHEAAEAMLRDSPLMSVLGGLGEPIIAGSYQTGLMVYPDIDFALQSETTAYQDLIDIIPKLQSRLHPSSIKITDFANNPAESAIGHLGLTFAYNGRDWQISATVTKPGPIVTNPPELKTWLDNMSQEQRLIILRLKKELLNDGRYGSARSRPPYTFRSVHLYEGVLVGGAKTVADLEKYFVKNQGSV